MALTRDDDNTYNLSNTPTVTIDGGSGSQRMILVIVAANRSDTRSLTDVILDGESADLVVSHSIDGATGRAVNGGFAIFKDAKCPAAGSVVLSATFSNTSSFNFFAVIEYSDVLQHDPIAGSTLVSATDLADASNIACVLTGQSGKYVLSYIATADGNTGVAGLHTDAGSQTTLGSSARDDATLEYGEDTSAASASEDYNWTISHDGSVTVDSIIAAAIAINEAVVTSAAVTGTVTATIDESDVVTGGKTIIITTTNDTWVE